MKFLNALLFFLLILVTANQLKAQDKKEPHILERPAAYLTHRDKFLDNVKRDWIRRQGPVPEQIWKTHIPSQCTTKPILFGSDKVLVPSLNEKAYHLDMKTGEKSKITSSLRGRCLLLYTEGIRLGAFNTNGRFLDFRIGMGGFKGRDCTVSSGMISAFALGTAGYVTRYKKSPVKIKMDVAELEELPDEDLPSPVTAPLAKTGPEFWMGLLDGTMLSYTKDLVKKPSTFKLKDTYANSIAGSYKYLVVTTTTKEVIVFDRVTKKELWRKKLAGRCFNTLSLEGDQLIVPAQNLYIFNIKDGKVIFERKNLSYEGFGRTKPVITNNRIYACDRKGYLHIFDRIDFKLFQAITLAEEVLTDFIYHDEKVYIATVTGNFYCLDVSFY